MRDRLIKLINQSDILCDTCGESTSSYCAEAIADYLIKSGVIVPPCKVGDMQRYIDADKLIAHLKDEIEGCKPPFCGRANGKSIAYGTILGLKSAISFAETLSTADVVPKSEVERLIIDRNAARLGMVAEGHNDPRGEDGAEGEDGQGDLNPLYCMQKAEVVRCKDCVWWEARTFGSTIGRCENPRNGLVNEYSEETDFCSYGERKE